MEKMMKVKTETSLKEVIFDKMNELENAFQRNDHLDPKKVDTIRDQLAWMSKMWVALSESDREWVQAAQEALEEQWEWK